MRSLALPLLLVVTLYAEDSSPAWVGIAKGDQGPGSYFAEIRIGRTVYVSRDHCKAAGYVSGPYPSHVDMRKNIVQLQVGNKVCTYHILDSRPLLQHDKTRSETKRKSSASGPG